MAYFDKTPVQFLQNLHFYKNVLKSILGFTTSFDTKNSAMKTNVDDTPSNPKQDVSNSFTFKRLISQHQDRLTFRHMKKKDMEYSQEGNRSSI